MRCSTGTGGDSSSEAPADLGDWVVGVVDEITRGAGDAIKLRPLTLGQGSAARPEDAVAAVLVRVVSYCGRLWVCM